MTQEPIWILGGRVRGGGHRHVSVTGGMQFLAKVDFLWQILPYIHALPKHV